MMLQLNKKYVYLYVSISQGVNTSRGSESPKSTSHFIESSQWSFLNDNFSCFNNNLSSTRILVHVLISSNNKITPLYEFLIPNL